MLRKIKTNKKGSIQDVFFVLVFIFILAIGFLVIKYIVPQITSGLKDSDMGTNLQVVKVLNSSENLVNHTIDGLYLMIFGFLVIGIIISGFMISAHPVFIPVFIILLAIIIVLGVIFSNAYEEMSEVVPLNTSAHDLTITSTIMGNLPIIIFIVGIITMVIIFAKIWGGSPPV